jgi:gliding motility-associated-like protein
LLLLFVTIVALNPCYSQCITNIDFNTWNQAGYTANGSWVVQNGGSQVHQTINGNPTFYLSPFKLICVRITGDFKTTDNDDDFMGFVFSFLNPLGQSDNYDGWLFDWKQVAQTSGGYNGQRGKALSRMYGTIPSSAYTQTFWGHQNTPEFTVAQNDFGGAGWVKNQTHQFELRLTYTHVTIFVDGDSVFDYDDCFLPGYFGFYNYSQKDCYYSNFNFEPYITFQAPGPTCLNDSAKFQFVNICQDSSLYDFSSYQSMTWDFGDGSTFVNNNIDINNVNPTHIYTEPGTYNVVLAVQDYQGCVGLDTQQVVIKASPVANFSVANVCDGAPAFFTENSSIHSSDSIQFWQWDFDDNTPFLVQKNVVGGHLYDSVGTYDVKLLVTSSLGCSDSIIQTLTIYPKPTANFGVVPVCFGSPNLFSDSSSTLSGNINSWEWDFNDNTPESTSQNSSHTYVSAGLHSTTLFIQNNLGCADTITKPVTVYFNPAANFTVDDICFNDSVFFIDSSHVDTSAFIDTYLWSFNDGSPTSTLGNTSHYYSSIGAYDVTLLVTTNQGCTDVVNKIVNVFGPPTSGFTVNDICLFDSALFVNTSLNPPQAIIQSWLWSFGDGSASSILQSPNHLYTNAGTYLVTLIAQSSNLGCADTVYDSITVSPIPNAYFNFSDVCLGATTFFIDSSVVSNPDSVIAWTWNFGEGELSFLQNPSYDYVGSGNYSVSLIVTTNNGCTDTIVQSTVVHPLPIVGFTANNVCLGDTTVFTNQSSIPPNPTNDFNSVWNWNVGDNNAPITSQNTIYVYDSIGNHTVQLKVVSDFGCADSVSQNVIVNPNPVVSFTVDTIAGCEPLCINFTNNSLIASGAIATYDWNLGNNMLSNPSISFVNCYYNDSLFVPQIHSVALTAISDSGCVASLNQSNYITVYPSPTASFTASPIITSIANPVVSIQNVSEGASVWNWFFGDSTISSLVSPNQHSYNDTGTYTIQLITANSYGCADTIQQNVIIEPDFMFYVPNAFTPNGDGVNDTFVGKGMFINNFEMLIFDRWGTLIYQTDDINKPWNGMVNGANELAKKEVYVYLIKVTDFKSNLHTYRGTVSLVK